MSWICVCSSVVLTVVLLMVVRHCQDRVIRAHENGVKLFRFDNRLQLAVSVGEPHPNPREAGITMLAMNAIYVWDVSQWIAEVYAKTVAASRRRRERFQAAVRRAKVALKLGVKFPMLPGSASSKPAVAAPPVASLANVVMTGRDGEAPTSKRSAMSGGPAGRRISTGRMSVSSIRTADVNVRLDDVSSGTDSDASDEVPTPRLVENFQKAPRPAYFTGHTCVPQTFRCECFCFF
jgi:hypothetical protein